ncbi:MAG TPA: histidine phosphatase family protein [Pseudonocardiaceae bacterium]
MTTRLLYLVRHGLHEKDPGAEAGDGNEDGALADDGRRQVALLAERLRGTGVVAVHHSTLRRGVETARVLREALDAPLRPSDDLREFVPFRPADDLLGEPHRRWFAEWPARILELGERRAAAVVERFAGTRDGQAELLVTHGNVIAWLVCEALDVPRHRWLTMPHFNAALTVIAYREGRSPSLVTYNDASHLPPELIGTDYPAELRP